MSASSASIDGYGARIPRALVLCLGILTLGLVATCVPGTFTHDEPNYFVTTLGLLDGRFTVPGTEGLTPSVELAYFEPGGRSRSLATSPAGATAPPLYAFLALPFSFLGWRGLVALNALAFAAAALMVFWLAGRHAREPATRWIAVAIYVLGGFTLEYAQGVWPHALAVALSLAGFLLSGYARESADRFAPYLAAAAGAMLGIGTGVRYQGLVFAFTVGLGLLFLAKRRVVCSVAFGLGFLPPLAACSWINHVRLGSWNPVNKGVGYLPTVATGQVGPPSSELLDAGRMLLARVVDFSFHPVPHDPGIEIAEWWIREPTGAVVMYGALKKAWLQSSPWLVLAFVALLMAWRRGSSGERSHTTVRARELRAMSIVFAGVLAMFSLAGINRHDGVCFNQRYFLELVPLAAVAAAWTLEGRFAEKAARWGVEAGVLLTLGFVMLVGPDTAPRQHVEYRLPLLLGLALLLALALDPWRRTSGHGVSTRPQDAPSAALSFLFGVALAWAAVIHVFEDIPADRACRKQKLMMRRDVEDKLPPGRIALLAYRPWPVALAPLQLGRDVVLLDVWMDAGATVDTLAAEFLAKGRRVVVVSPRMPRSVIAKLGDRFKIRLMREAFPALLVEVTARETHGGSS